MQLNGSIRPLKAQRFFCGRIRETWTAVSLKKHRSISALVIVLATAVFCAVWLNRGPRYQGKSARHWVGQLVRNETAARRALLELGPAAVPALAEALSARPSCLEKKLGSFRPRLPRWISRRLLSPVEASVRQQRALEVLDMLGPSAAPAIPALLELDHRVSDEFYFYPASPQRVILGIGEAGVPQLIHVLGRGKEQTARIRAAMYLGLIGAKAAPAASVLAEALRDSSPAVRKEAVTALDQIGPPAADALPALRAALELDNDEFRLQVVQALWDVGQDVERTVPVLVKVLRDPHHPNRARAATILARMGPAAKAAAPALTAVTQEQFSYTRVKAEEALKQIGGGPATPGTDKLE
jgi:HEAT repeat protein